jgi:hypothetical protein
MKSIYNNASQVLIWLGEASEKVDEETGLCTTEIFMTYFSRMAAEIRQLGDDGKHTGSSVVHRNLLAAVYQEAVNGKASFLTEGFWHIYYRRWWDRVWVVQEAAFAKCAIFICSEHTPSYSDLLTWHNALIWSLNTPKLGTSTGGSLAAGYYTSLLT